MILALDNAMDTAEPATQSIRSSCEYNFYQHDIFYT